MRKILTLTFLVLLAKESFCWGFYAHRKINYYAIFLLPPEMNVLYKPYAAFLMEHAVDPDKRRYAVAWEAPRPVLQVRLLPFAAGLEDGGEARSDGRPRWLPAPRR